MFKKITTATPQDMIRFMAFKDVSDSVRMVVHDTECPHIGNTSLSVDCLPTKCMQVMAADSLRTGVIVPRLQVLGHLFKVGQCKRYRQSC